MAYTRFRFVRNLWSSHNTDEIVFASRIVPFITIFNTSGRGTIRV